ncbi:hypothetical protein BO94DRAFT_563173 [Aspergillus sclerotioniger CBS 115572]|uniref:Zn(2)-C6 fungal-type domain-containing protein n=1 Tax=Aspergillus sclerotioniger CBS 115572 TaxID=1450535 RepID=A0A317X7H1_9EURO|nr:hypothetical protein BO94DRAFT_563173 [Aspergillus sclerotioniger CBS 115572]PWY94566.1 hypothetical protein BO94DRAFT_563173 [Aspergillus sclerotioniger CBS 115572]
MFLSEKRPIKRPRVSLSCIACRRRKVRCTREQPACANCIRTKETCVYSATSRDDNASQIPQVPPPQERNSGASEPRTQDLTWSHWVSEETDMAINLSEEPAPYAAATTTKPRSRRELNASSSLALPSTLSVNPSPALSSNLTISVYDRALVRDTSAKLSGDLLPERALMLTLVGWVQEALSDDFFDDNRNTDPDLPPSYISSMGMFNLLQSLPTKAVSDALLKVFLFAVWPLSPLVHCPSLQADYDEFWEWCRNSDTAVPPGKVRDDPTFLCLLFAILYCGASAAPEASWMGASLQDVQKETTVNNLRSAYETSISLCHHLDHPTLNSLVSTLLTSPFLYGCKPMYELISVSMTLRLAQSMGLHREDTWSALSPVDRDIRRRIWWHIVRLDLQSSISTGLPPCCGSEALDAVDMMASASVKDISDPSVRSSSPDPMGSKPSIALIFAVGCSETARLQSRTVTRLQSGRILIQNELRGLVTAARRQQQKIDTLIASIPSQGIPERGLIPSRLANASPSTHPSLYNDDATQPTVLSAWTRIMLTLLKFDMAILLQKPFLPPPDRSNPQSCKAWTSMAQLCVSYLRIILPIYQSSAFSPYTWFCRSYHGPLQCVFLTLIYLDCFRDSKETTARYFVDEIMEHIVSHYQGVHSSTARNTPDSQSPSKTQLPLAIQVLVDLHNRLDSPSEPDDHSQTKPSSPTLTLYHHP